MNTTGAQGPNPAIQARMAAGSVRKGAYCRTARYASATAAAIPTSHRSALLRSRRETNSDIGARGLLYPPPI